MDGFDIGKALSEHPCYNEEAHHKYARMHLPVAPKCNIQCNYCNRKFDCCNESRPGVTSEVLSPEQAVSKVSYVRSKIPELRVIGIAGPGDPLANESTFRTLELIKAEHPDLTLCISTNGLALPENVDRLYELGVRFVTVTINAVDPEIGARVYASVSHNGSILRGIDGASLLLSKQLDGIKKCADLGMIVKANMVMVPGINADHIPEIVRKVRSLGAQLVNIIPLIPVKGTAFQDLVAPTPKERKELMDKCSVDAKMMRHCRQCRADAIGRLGEDRSSEFSGCGSGCGPLKDLPVDSLPGTDLAFASSNGKDVDCGFGNTPFFEIYTEKDGKYVWHRRFEVDLTVPVNSNAHRQHLSNIAKGLKGCASVYVTEIGHLPKRMLTDLGIDTIVTDGNIQDIIDKL